MYPLLGLSFVAIVTIVERLMAFRQYGDVSSELLATVLSYIRAGRYDEALTESEKRRGPLAASVAVIIRRRAQPTHEIERVVEETGQDYFLRLERFLPILDTTTTIAPLLGLLGTVFGMIGAFNAIALQAGRGNNDAVLAGVGQALFSTATGLIIAVMCFGFYNYFAARLRNIVSQTEQGATKLINALTDRQYVERGGLPGNPIPDEIGLEDRHEVQAS
jgi:biopolymer transport protein ExbB